MTSHDAELVPCRRDDLAGRLRSRVHSAMEMRDMAEHLVHGRDRRINLASELGPLLAELREATSEKYRDCIEVLESDAEKAGAPLGPGLERSVSLFESDLSSLIETFQEYYKLDAYDLDALADQFVSQSDHWESPTGGSIYCHIARAADDVQDVKDLIHSEQWKKDQAAERQAQGAASLAARSGLIYAPRGQDPSGMPYWHDSAALAFQKNFLDPFLKNTAEIHAAGARELAIAAKSLANAIEFVKEYVIEICKYGLALVGEGERELKGLAGLAAILTDAVALFKAIAAPEKVALDIFLSGVGVVGGLLAESESAGHSSYEEPPLEFTPDPDIFVPGCPAVLAIGKMKAAFSRLTKSLSDFDETISRGLHKDLSASGPLGCPYARIGRQDLTSAYTETTVKSGLDADDTGNINPVVANYVKLYYAGFVSLPTAASEYDIGRRICADVKIDGLKEFFSKSLGKFDQAVGELGEHLSALRDDFHRYGDAMVTAAKSYEEVDASAAAQIRQFESEIPSPDAITGANYYTPPVWLK